jgi:PBP1b-binding outer membrane lipoprotein LpoB
MKQFIALTLLAVLLAGCANETYNGPAHEDSSD